FLCNPSLYLLDLFVALSMLACNNYLFHPSLCIKKAELKNHQQMASLPVFLKGQMYLSNEQAPLTLSLFDRPRVERVRESPHYVLPFVPEKTGIELLLPLLEYLDGDFSDTQQHLYLL